MARRNASTRIDLLMEHASQALVATRYFEAERLAMEAMAAARSVSAFERMARICMPLQEARRQRVSIALDLFGNSGMAPRGEAPPGSPAKRRGRRGGAAPAGDRPVAPGVTPSGKARDTNPAHAHLVDFAIPDDLHRLPAAFEPGCWLVQPPNVAADARRLRLAALEREVPAVVLCREPLTRSGTCPVVAVGALVIRVYVGLPADCAKPDLRWFAAAMESLGDAAMADALREVDPIRRVDALLVRLDAVPEHEKLHQALAAACDVAARAPG